MFLFLSLLITVSLSSFAQNTFPLSGNAGLGISNPLSGGTAAPWLTINGSSNYSGGIIYSLSGLAKAFSYFDVDGLFTQQSMGSGQKFVVNGSTVAMSIATSGNIGFGTTNPISGGAAASWLTINGATDYSGGIVYATQGVAKGFSFIDHDGLLTQQSIGSGQKFVVNSSTTAMYIASSGNVGIGTATPKEALSVNGSIRSKQVTVELANWPDYVFDSSYKRLNPIQLEAYIQKNKHLPEIPAASSVEQEGMNLGEMNKILVKKIEELTLYMIEQHKEIEKLKAKIH